LSSLSTTYVLGKQKKNLTLNATFVFSGTHGRGGDVQSGKLRKLNVDVAIGPGGVGAWRTPPRYRMELRRFIQRGGGFYGICGDSYLGTVETPDIPGGTRGCLRS